MPSLEEISTLIIFAAVIILIWVLRKALKSIKSGNPLSKDAASILTTIGIFFTFLGISIALYHFDPQNINKSIPELLGGLKVAFFSSVGGLGAGLFFKYKKLRFERKTNAEGSGRGAEDLYSVLEDINKTIAEGNKNIKDALTGEDDASLSIQISELRKDFKGFADKVAEDGSNKLIEALEKVIKDFNQKISEQFGENFKQLNEAVGALLIWQKEHKEHVEKLTEAYEKTTLSIEEINNSFKDIQGSTAKIPDNMQSIEKVFDNANERISEMYEGLKSLSDMRQKAEESLPFIQEQITNMTDSLKQSVDTQIASIQKNIQAMKDSNDESKTFIKNMNDEITKSHNDTQEKLNTAIQEVNNKMNEQLNSSLQILGNNLESISKGLADSYQKSTEQINKAINENNN